MYLQVETLNAIYFTGASPSGTVPVWDTYCLKTVSAHFQGNYFNFILYFCKGVRRMAINNDLYKVRHVRDLKDMLNKSSELFGSRNAFYIKRDGNYTGITYNELKRM